MISTRSRPGTLLTAKAILCGDMHDLVVLPPGVDPRPIVAGRPCFELPMQDGYQLLLINDGPSLGTIATLAGFGYRYDSILGNFIDERGAVL